MRQVDIQARSVEEAVRLALEQLGRSRSEVKIEVLATDPGGEEVLVRVSTQDSSGPQAGTSSTGPMRGGYGRDRGGAARPERQMARPPMPHPTMPNVQADEFEDEEDDNRGNRIEEAIPAGGGVVLDESLQAGAVDAGEAATPGDAVAPMAAEILQRILMGMKIRGRIVRREASEEGEAAFEDDSDSVVLNVMGLNERDQSILIGRRGETLDALQFIVNLILGRKVDLWARVIVDVEGYRLRRKLALINLARRTADQVQTRQQAIPLEAMSAYERRIIHMTLQEHPEVTTESSGAEPERRVVVLPK